MAVYTLKAGVPICFTIFGRKPATQSVLSVLDAHTHSIVLKIPLGGQVSLGVTMKTHTVTYVQSMSLVNINTQCFFSNVNLDIHSLYLPKERETCSLDMT